MSGVDVLDRLHDGRLDLLLEHRDVKDRLLRREVNDDLGLEDQTLGGLFFLRNFGLLNALETRWFRRLLLRPELPDLLLGLKRSDTKDKAGKSGREYG